MTRQYHNTPSGILLPDEPFQPGTVKPEEYYEAFSKLGAALSLPCPQAHVSLESRDANGNLVDLYEARSRTLNRNYWNWLFKGFGGFIATTAGGANAMASDTTYGAGHLTNKTTAAAVTNTNSTTFQCSPVGSVTAIANTSSGIVVGTGTAAESFEDVALGALIATGNASGQLAYQAQALATPTYNAGSLTWTWTAVRIMNNNSGGTIVIGEMAYYFTQGGGGVYMLMRDKLTPTVSVLNAGQATATYTFTLVFPA